MDELIERTVRDSYAIGGTGTLVLFNWDKKCPDPQAYEKPPEAPWGIRPGSKLVCNKGTFEIVVVQSNRIYYDVDVGGPYWSIDV